MPLASATPEERAVRAEMLRPVDLFDGDFVVRQLNMRDCDRLMGWANGLDRFLAILAESPADAELVDNRKTCNNNAYIARARQLTRAYQLLAEANGKRCRSPHGN